MSEEKKDLGDKAEDAFDKAKKTAKEAAEDAKEATGKAKEKASDFAEEAKEAAKDFKEDVKDTFDPNKADNGKTVAIIAHITVIGWIIAIVMNSQNKSEFGSYYIRQTLGIWILMVILSFIPIVGCFASLLGLILIIMSVINAANGKMVLTPVVGQYFQDWFKSL